MTKSTLKEAKIKDTETIVQFLAAMADELKEFKFDSLLVTQKVSGSFKESIHWFLFLDEKGQPFGTCHLQSVYNYWRQGNRYYLGGFYIAPSHRGQGRFRAINTLLKKWVEEQGGVQIYAHIHKDNQKSLKTFESVNLTPTGYLLCAHHWGD